MLFKIKFDASAFDPQKDRSNFDAVDITSIQFTEGKSYDVIFVESKAAPFVGHCYLFLVANDNGDFVKIDSRDCKYISST